MRVGLGGFSRAVVLGLVISAAGYAGYLWFDSLKREGAAIAMGGSAIIVAGLVYFTREITGKLDKLLDAAGKFEISAFTRPVYDEVKGIRRRLTYRFAFVVLAGAVNAALAVAVVRSEVTLSTARVMAAFGVAGLAAIVFYVFRALALYNDLDDYQYQITKAVEAEKARAKALLDATPSRIKRFPEKSAALAGSK
jgi:hypothetical protein